MRHDPYFLDGYIIMFWIYLRKDRPGNLGYLVFSTVKRRPGAVVEMVQALGESSGPGGGALRPARQARIHPGAAPARRLVYVYDYGDDRRHDVIVEDVRDGDLRNKQLVIEIIREIEQPVVLVTHDLDHLLDFDRVIMFDEGCVTADGPPDSTIREYPKERVWIRTFHFLHRSAKRGAHIGCHLSDIVPVATPGTTKRWISGNSEGSAVYEGEYRDGTRHGRGTMAYASGDRFEGESRLKPGSSRFRRRTAGGPGRLRRRTRRSRIRQHRQMHGDSVDR